MTENCVRLGTNPIAWSNDDLRSLGGDTPLAVCLAQAREAGYDGIELGHKFPRSAPELRAVLQAHDLALVSGWYSMALLERDASAELSAMQPHLDLLKALGADLVIVAETTAAVHGNRAVPLSQRPVLDDSQWAGFARRLTSLAEAVAGTGLALAYHHHMGTVVQSGTEIDRLMDATGPAVQLLLDTGHAAFAGADPVALARSWAGRVGHVHCKDVRPAVMREADARDWSFLDSVVAGVFTVPGDGAVDFAAVLGALPAYRGWLVVEAEQDPEKANPLHYAQLGRAGLLDAARRAGMLAGDA